MRAKRWLYTIPLRLRSLFRRSQVERELDEEFRDHVEHLTAEHIARGLPPAEARLAALRAMGGVEQQKERCRDARRVRVIEETIADLRYGCRALVRDARFTLVAVATLAVGVGLNAAVFSIVSAVMLRGLPYRDADRLISLWEETTREQPATMQSSGAALGGAAGASREAVAPANLMDYRRSSAFTGLAGFALHASNLTGNGSPERLQGESVTANYLRVLGVSPAMGRDFTEADDRPGAEPTVLVTYDCWQRRFGGDAGILGREIRLDDRPFQVIGVLPAGFRSPAQLALPDPIEFYVPAAYPDELLANHGDHEIGVLGRLKPGASIAAAQAELDAIGSALARQYPDTNRGIRPVITALDDDLVRNVRVSLLVLLGAVALIVVIACVNVANLMLVRAGSRHHETSVRFALGASRGRVVRQFIAESVLLSVAGCAVGVLLGDAIMHVLTAAAPPNIPRLDAVAMDWRVLGVSAAVATVSAMLFGALPAWQASRTRPAESMKAAGRAVGARSQLRWRAALTVAELSISLVLLVGAGLLIKSFATVMGMELGFRTDRVMSANINLPELRYRTAPSRLHFFEQLERRLASLPGVESVAFANRMPMRGGWSSGVVLEGGGDDMHESDFQAVSPGYFRTVGMTLVRGRLLAASDRDGRMPVAVVNRTLARRLFGTEDPVNRRLRRSGAPWLTIVGVVNDVRRAGKTGEIRPQVYLAAAQTSLYPVRLADLAVRSFGEPHALLPAIRSAVWSLDKDLPLTNVKTLDEIVGASVKQRRFHMLLLIVFAGVAVTLSLVGIFGVLSYAVGQRTPEFGVRLALGATSGTILVLVLRQAIALIAAGAVVGLTGAWGLTRYLQSLLFEVQPHDLGIFAATAGVLVVVAIAASVVPARRAARVDPLVALRYE